MKYSAYPEYQDSDLKWVGKFPKHWEKKKVKHLFRISKEKSFEKNPTILSLTLKGIKIRDISSNEGQIAASYDGYHKIRKGDIVMNPMDLISGFVDCAKIEGVISPAYSTLRPIKELNPDFYNYYFQKHYYEKIFFPFAEGVSIEYRWTLKNEDLMNFYLIEPPLDEQLKISSFLDHELDKIDLIIEKYENLIELLKEKRITLISHLATKGLDKNVEMKDSGVEWIGEIPKNWEIKKLKQVADVKISNVDKKSKPDEPKVELCNYVDVYKNEFITSNIDFMKATATFEQIKKLKIQKDDIIITKDSETPEDIAVPALVKDNSENVICGYHLALIRPKKFIKGEFLLRLLQSKKISEQFMISANGVTRFGISTYPIKNSLILMAPISEQIQIIKYLSLQTDKIDILIEKIKKQIPILKEYKISLISHAVTGKIDVREQASK